LTDAEKSKLLRDVLLYANSNPDSFKRDINEIQFDPVLKPLPIILEALSKDTETWGDFYVAVLNDILNKAEQIDRPGGVLTYISEFYYIEEASGDFVQKIADLLLKARKSESEKIQLKAICTLPGYLRNPAIKNRDLILNCLIEKLDDKNWKARYLSFKYLKYEGLLLEGRRLSFKDMILKTFLGEPEQI